MAKVTLGEDALEPHLPYITTLRQRRFSSDAIADLLSWRGVTTSAAAVHGLTSEDLVSPSLSRRSSFGDLSDSASCSRRPTHNLPGNTCRHLDTSLLETSDLAVMTLSHHYATAHVSHLNLNRLLQGRDPAHRYLDDCQPHEDLAYSLQAEMDEEMAEDQWTLRIMIRQLSLFHDLKKYYDRSLKRAEFFDAYQYFLDNDHMIDIFDDENRLLDGMEPDIEEEDDEDEDEGVADVEFSVKRPPRASSAKEGRGRIHRRVRKRKRNDSPP